MAEELGKITKPEAGQFVNKRKLYLIPLLYSWNEAPPEYTEMFERYWVQVREHIDNLESKMGTVNRIYHESISVGGEEGLNILEKINPLSFAIIKDKCDSGAQVEALEDREMVEEAMDWERHLLMGFISQTVARIVSENYTDASKKRYEYIGTKLDETFKENEAALIFIREDHHVQFPPDIEVFSVAPPALNELQRWVRDRSAANAGEEPDEPKDT